MSKNSLDLLNPRPFASRNHAWISETAKQIEQTSLELIRLASSREWKNPVFGHITPDYKAEFDHSDGVDLDSWDAYVKHHERLATANPEYRFESLDSVADIYENTGTGSVYILLRVTGHPVNVVRESIIVMYWKREREEWKCHGQKVIRGMLWNA